MKFSDVLARTTALVGASLLGSAALAADAQLWGAIKGPDGARMGGVTVSAKAQGSTITTKYGETIPFEVDGSRKYRLRQ